MIDLDKRKKEYDEKTVKLGYVSRILYYLRSREVPVHSEIYSDVEPDPDVETILRGVDRMKQFQPDVIIALGGGSAIDAAKGMWLFYEHPETTFDGLKLKFMDIRKRALKFLTLGQKVQFVAIPTTSRTGSEVTAFSVITDRKNGNIKYPLADYALTPDVVIIDPQFVMSLPRNAVADPGMDVLTHALEAYVSIMASDYTAGLALQAIDMVFEYLPGSYDDADPTARGKMHNASCIAGMAFTNAFLGLNHSMAHKLGGEYHIPHGRANAVLLPYLITAVRGLMRKLNVPMSIRECGVDEAVFFSRLEALAENAHADQCTGANPRYPLIREIMDLYSAAFRGDEPVIG